MLRPRVSGSLRLSSRIGGIDRSASLAEGAGTAELTFRYQVARADRATRGIAVGRMIGLPDGVTIRDAAGNAAAVGLPALTTAGIRIDGRLRPRLAR